jgi:anti-anti-sigma factor
VIRVIVAGEIDIATVGLLDTALTAAIARGGTTAVEVDFAGVTFCDSAGIAALDTAAGTAAQGAILFRLIDVQFSVARVLQIVGLLEVLTAHRDVQPGPSA